MSITARQNAQEIFEGMKAITSEIIGEDVLEIIGFHRDSEFLGDFEMDSIKIVALAERVNDVYGEYIDFVAWLSKKPIRKLVKLTVGEVADAIAKGN